MSLCAGQPRSVFLGQSVRVKGTAMFGTLEGVPIEKRIELPVFENTQLGMAIGMSLAGDLPICIFPRWNFLLEATSQLVQHLDKMPLYGNGYRPKVIIRTAVATAIPLDPGPQHLGDFTDAFRAMLQTVRVVRLDAAEQVVPEYRAALERDGSTLLVERTELYG